MKVLRILAAWEVTLFIAREFRSTADINDPDHYQFAISSARMHWLEPVCTVWAVQECICTSQSETRDRSALLRHKTWLSYLSCAPQSRVLHLPLGTYHPTLRDIYAGDASGKAGDLRE